MRLPDFVIFLCVIIALMYLIKADMIQVGYGEELPQRPHRVIIVEEIPRRSLKEPPPGNPLQAIYGLP